MCRTQHAEAKRVVAYTFASAGLSVDDVERLTQHTCARCGRKSVRYEDDDASAHGGWLFLREGPVCFVCAMLGDTLPV